MLRHTDAWGYYLFQSQSFGSSAFTPGPFNWYFVVDSTQKLLNHCSSSAGLCEAVRVCKPVSLIVQTSMSSGRSTEKQNGNWKTCWGNLPDLHKDVNMLIIVLPAQVQIGFGRSKIEYIFCLIYSLYHPCAFYRSGLTLALNRSESLEMTCFRNLRDHGRKAQS